MWVIMGWGRPQAQERGREKTGLLALEGISHAAYYLKHEVNTDTPGNEVGTKLSVLGAKNRDCGRTRVPWAGSGVKGDRLKGKSSMDRVPHVFQVGRTYCGITHVVLTIN